MVSLNEIKAAAENMKGVVRRTPLLQSKAINPNADVYIKCENLQNTGAFKLRGAYTKISSLSDEEKKNGIIAASSGNHAQGASLAATMLGIRSVICMPDSAPMAKVQGTRNNGGEVVLVPGVFDDAYEKAMQLVKEEGMTYVAPFDDEKIITGQGTIGLEIMEDLPDAEVVFVPIGGGGICSGIACAIKQINPNVKVIGVEPANAACMRASLDAGHVVGLDSAVTMADGTAVKKPSQLTYDYIKEYVDDVVVITEEELTQAMLLMIEKNKMVAEGAGSLSVAAAMFNKYDIAGKKVVCVISGGNADVTSLSRIIDKALHYTGRLVEIHATLSDKAGQLAKLLAVIAETGANVKSINHDRVNGEANVAFCTVEVVVETTGFGHKAELEEALTKAGFKFTTC